MSGSGRSKPAPWAVAALLAALALTAALPASWALPPTAGTAAAWTDQDAMLLFYEAMTALDRQALERRPAGQAVRAALKAYLRDSDPYGDYLSATEYAAWREAQGYHFHGVGMDLVRNGDGEFVCLPQPGGPAALGGIRQGDLLLAVDGAPVKGASLFLTGARIRGAKDSLVRLEVRAPGQARGRTVSLRRKPVVARTVWPEDKGDFLLLRISTFSAHTPRELAQALGSAPGRPKVLDLRGNAGGDLFAAVDAVGLLLPAGSQVMTLRTRQASTPYRTAGRAQDPDSRLFILQDQYTASAAEVFTAALVQNQRATSLGRPSFGKGLAQRIVELSDGSALVVTYAELIPPSGLGYAGKGLTPTHPVPAEAAGEDAAWFALARRLLAESRRGVSR